MIHKKNKIRKRYILLIVIAILPLFLLIHPNDYCFGIADLFIIGAIAIAFFIAFLVVLFYNLYKISLKIELFNFRPILIFLVFGVGLYFGIKYHNQQFFKTIAKSFITVNHSGFNGELLLFTDGSCQYQLKHKEYSCFYKGEYQYKKDTLILKNIQLSNNELPKKYLVNQQFLKNVRSHKKVFKQLNKNELHIVKTK